MSVDFPRAWQITRATEPEYHHNQCSYNQAGMLCDCNILMQHPETLSTEFFYGADGKILSEEPKESPI